MTDQLKDEVLNTALNAVIKAEVVTKIYEDTYIIRVIMIGKKDYIDTLTMQSFRNTKTHVLLDNVMKRFRHYLLTEYIDSTNWKTVFDYLCNKEFQKSEGIQ